MIIRALCGCRMSYSSGVYSLCVSSGGYMCAYHPCPRSEGKDDCIDYIRVEEMRDSECAFCGELDIPEELQALYILYKYGRGEL